MNLHFCLYSTFFAYLFCQSHADVELTTYAFPLTCPDEGFYLRPETLESGGWALLNSSFQEPYANNTKCRVNVLRPESGAIVFSIKEFDLRPNCTDNVTIYVFGKRRIQYCNETAGQHISKTLFSSASVRIEFRTGPGSTDGYKGFSFAFAAAYNNTMLSRYLQHGFSKWPIRTKCCARVIFLRRNVYGSNQGNSGDLTVLWVVLPIAILVVLAIKYCRCENQENDQLNCLTSEEDRSERTVPEQTLDSIVDRSQFVASSSTRSFVAPPPPYASCKLLGTTRHTFNASKIVEDPPPRYEECM